MGTYLLRSCKKVYALLWRAVQDLQAAAFSTPKSWRFSEKMLYFTYNLFLMEAITWNIIKLLTK